MSKFSDSFRSFKEGLRWRLLWDYWITFKATAWEIFWGASMIGILFGIYTLFRAPSTVLLLAYVLVVVFMAGYYMWRADHVRLIPKLEVGDARVVDTPTTIQENPWSPPRPGPDRAVAQLLVRCATDAPVSECRGRLLRVWRWSQDTWEPTEVDEPLELLWSTVDQPMRDLSPETAQQLCLFRIDDGEQRIRPWVQVMQHRMAAVFDRAGRNDIFKFDIATTGKDSPAINLSLRIQMGLQWNRPVIERL